MSDEAFAINLMRATAASLQFQCQMTCAREMFSKSYFSLGLAEKGAVDQALFAHISMNFQALTPEFLGAGTTQQAGFLAGMRADQPALTPAVAAVDTKTGSEGQS